MTRSEIAELESLANSWVEEAGRRHKVSAVDPVADALTYTAAELLERLRLLKTSGAELNVEDFAHAHNVEGATVRRWCRTGRIIGARLTPNGYKIPADAKPPLRKAS